MDCIQPTCVIQATNRRSDYLQLPLPPFPTVILIALHANISAFVMCHMVKCSSSQQQLHADLPPPLILPTVILIAFHANIPTFSRVFHVSYGKRQLKHVSYYG